MKKYSLSVMTLVLFSFLFSLGVKGQYKIVSIESEDIYFRYFNGNKHSERKKNDSISYLCFNGGRDTIHILKVLHNTILWARQFELRKSPSSLNITTLKVGDKRPSKETKEYFVAVFIKEIFKTAE